MVQPLLASSGTGYGTSSLDDDAYQLDQLADHLASFYNSQVPAAAELPAPSRAVLRRPDALRALQQGRGAETAAASCCLAIHGPHLLVTKGVVVRLCVAPRCLRRGLPTKGPTAGSRRLCVSAACSLARSRPGAAPAAGHCHDGPLHRVPGHRAVRAAGVRG